MDYFIVLKNDQLLFASYHMNKLITIFTLFVKILSSERKKNQIANNPTYTFYLV